MRRSGRGPLLRRAVLCAAALAPALAHADEPASTVGRTAVTGRTVDFQSGLVLDEPRRDGIEALPGVGVQLRWFGANALWIAAAASFEASADLRDPERGELASLLAVGGGAGLWVDLGDRLTLFGGGRLEYVHGWSWPDATSAASHDVDGLRAGPSAALAVLVGHAWGHPMYVEGRVSWLAYRVDAEVEPARGWQGGLFLTGVLFPDR